MLLELKNFAKKEEEDRQSWEQDILVRISALAVQRETGLVLAVLSQKRSVQILAKNAQLPPGSLVRAVQASRLGRELGRSTVPSIVMSRLARITKILKDHAFSGIEAPWMRFCTFNY